jgi:hypothetical protein
MIREWGNHETSLQKLKGIINFNPPRKRFVLSNQMNKRGHYSKLFGNEKSIKVNKSKKTLDISNKC